MSDQYNEPRQILISPQMRRDMESRPMKDALETHRKETVKDVEKDRAIQCMILKWSIAAVIVGGLTLLVATLTLWAALGRQSFANQQGESHNTENQVDDENNHRSDLKF